MLRRRAFACLFLPAPFLPGTHELPPHAPFPGARFLQAPDAAEVLQLIARISVPVGDLTADPAWTELMRVAMTPALWESAGLDAVHDERSRANCGRWKRVVAKWQKVCGSRMY